MNNLAGSDPQSPRRKGNLIPVVIVVLVLGFLLWLTWCMSKDACFTLSEEACIEYGLEQDALNPDVNDVSFSFLASPGELTYPWYSKYKREEGSVTLRIEIDEAGNVISHEITQSSGFDDLDVAAIASLPSFNVDLEKLGATEFPVSKSLRFNFALR